MNAYLPRHVQQRMHYREKRYMRHLTDGEVEERINDIMLNLLALNDEAKISLLPLHEKETHIWLEKWTHILEEMVLRHGPYPAGMRPNMLTLPDLASDRAERAVELMRRFAPQNRNVLIKYGKREFMEPLLKKGQLRLQPASYFNEPSHNAAVRDDELNLHASYVLSREDIVKIVKNPQDVPPVIPDQRVNVTHFVKTDYWLYCQTFNESARHFVDFDNADCCVIFHQPLNFTNRLREVASEVMMDANFMQGRVKYYDPIIPVLPRPHVPFSKHFRYTYQTEHRICWIPKNPVEKVEPVDLELGSFEHEAELVII